MSRGEDIVPEKTVPFKEREPKEGDKFDNSKTRYDLMSPIALEYLALVYTFGAVKYKDHNWRKGIRWSRIFGAIMRHLWAWMLGEDVDDESGLPHLAHAMWGCATLLEYAVICQDKDDRFRNKMYPKWIALIKEQFKKRKW